MGRPASGSSLLMHTTKKSAKETAGEMMAKLLDAGATGFHVESENGKMTGVAFSLLTPGGTVACFKIPIKPEGVLATMKQEKSKGRKLSKVREEQAEKTAWRMAFRWVEVQLTFIAAGQAETMEVFMPYMLNANGTKTLYEHTRDSGVRGFLAAPEE